MDNVIYLVAGGPSLSSFDFNRLKGKRIIAINRAYEVLPFAETVYFSDDRFFDWHKKGLADHQGEKVSGARKLETEMPITFYHFTGIDGLDLQPGCLRHGNNSGYAAINLAVHYGAKKIILLGYDMKFNKAGDSHWHEGYPTTARERVFDKMISHFDTLVKPLAELNIEVFNTNHYSRLKVFPFIELDKAL